MDGDKDRDEQLEKDVRDILKYARGKSRQLGMKIEARSFYEFPPDWTNSFFHYMEDHTETLRFLYGTPRKFNPAEDEHDTRHTNVDIEKIANQLLYGPPTSNSVQLYFFIDSPHGPDRKDFFPLVEFFCDDKSYTVIAQPRFAKSFLNSLNNYMESKHRDWEIRQPDQRTFLHLQSYPQENLPEIIKLARLRYVKRNMTKN